MQERLIENWLDSATERSYQRCFLQMLSGQGYRVVHNTEHTPLEFGKDVIAVSSESRLCGYQLKGNPGGTLKPRDFDGFRGQLEQLATLSLAIPGFEGRILDECYLVTNDSPVLLGLKLTSERGGRVPADSWKSPGRARRFLIPGGPIGRPLQHSQSLRELGGQVTS